MDRLGSLKLRQLEAKLEHLRPLASLSVPREGWVRSIREVLGLTARQLADRLDLTQSAVSQLERAEKEGRITLNTLRSVAEAINCDLVYALVPRRSLESIIRNRARYVAEQRMEKVWHSMALEAQETSLEEKQRQISDLTEELLSGDLRDLWRDE